MGVPLRIGTLDASGTCVNTHFGDVVAVGSSTPSSGALGYAKGSFFINATTGTIYRNDGTKASASFVSAVTAPADRIVNCTSSTLTVTQALHDGKIIVLDRAAGIAVTLPTAAAGLRFRFIVKTTFSGAARISVAGQDYMVGHALMGNDTNNNVVDWQAVATDINTAIDLFGTANSTGGMEGEEIEVLGLAANIWFVSIRGDAAGTEATPWVNS